MHDPRPQFAADRGQLLKVMQQRIDQRSAVARIFGRSRSRMHHHARGLVDDRQVIVLVDDVERNFFWDGAQRWSVWRPGDRDLLVAIALQSQRRLGRRPVHQHLACLNELLNPGAAHFCVIDL